MKHGKGTLPAGTIEVPGRTGNNLNQPMADSTMNEPGQGAHLRRWPRYKIDVRLKVLFAEGGDSPAFGRGNNLSHGGMGAYIPCAIPVGAHVVLEITFPHSAAEIKLRAVIRTVDGFRYGLEFVDVPDQVRELIEKSGGSGLA